MTTKPQLPKETIKAVFRGLLQTNKPSSARAIIEQHYPYASEWVTEALAEDAAKKPYLGYNIPPKVEAAPVAETPEVEAEVNAEVEVKVEPPKALKKEKTPKAPKLVEEAPAPTPPPVIPDGDFCRPPTKLDRARRIWGSATDKSRKTIVPIFVEKLGMTESGATSYFYKLSKDPS
jgi:hypothetical protein